MAKRSKKEAGAEYLQDVLKLIPEDKRGVVEDALKAEPVVELLGERLLRQDEFSRLADETRQKEAEALQYRERLNQWYGEKQQEIAEGTAALAELENLKKKPSREDSLEEPALDIDTISAKLGLKDYIKGSHVAELLARQRQEIESQGLAIVMATSNLSARHLHDFREPLDTITLTNHARLKGLDLVAAYNDLYSDKIQSKRDADQKAEREKLKKEIREEVMKEQSMPYPSSDEPSTLYGLSADKQETGVKAALDAYHKRGR